MLKKLRKIALFLVSILSIHCIATPIYATEADPTEIDLSANSVLISDKEYTFADINFDINELASILKNEKEIPRKALLNVKNIQQLPELPAGCEITSTTIALNYLGFNCSKMELLNYMPIMKSPDKNGRWASPWDVFVGDPRLSYYGAYSPVIKKTIENYFEKNKITDYSVNDLSGSSMEGLYREIADGNPIIVWATIRMSPVKQGNSWTLQDGTRFIWTSGEHCLVLIGYDKDKNTITLSDPYDKRGTVTYDATLFEKRYTELFKQALVVKKEK